MLPGPATTDVVGRLSALSPGDRVTSSLPCRALCRQRSAGADVSANIRAGQMVIRSIYTPHADRHLSSARPDFLRLSVVVTPLPRYPPCASPTRPAPVPLALRQSRSAPRPATTVAPAPDAIPLADGQHAADDSALRRGQDLSRFAALSRRSRSAALALRPASLSRRSCSASRALRPASLSRRSLIASRALRPVSPSRRSRMAASALRPTSPAAGRGPRLRPCARSRSPGSPAGPPWPCGPPRRAVRRAARRSAWPTTSVVAAQNRSSLTLLRLECSRALGSCRSTSFHFQDIT